MAEQLLACGVVESDAVQWTSSVTGIDLRRHEEHLHKTDAIVQCLDFSFEV